VKLHWIAGGHALTREDLEAGREWFGFSSLSGKAGRPQW
jgi:predicted esterase